MRFRAICLSVLLGALLSSFATAPAGSQTSASYKLQEASVNSGGDPRSTGTLVSAHYHITLDAIGDGAVRAGLSSASFHVDGGFVGRYRPPGEVTGDRFTSATTLQWNSEVAAGQYEAYRGTTTSLPGTFGTCFASGLPTTTVADASNPQIGAAFFYLITARNSLLEEGTKGYRSNGTERGNPSPCP